MIRSFLGTVDKLGNSYTGDHLATGFGQHLAIPLLRKHWKPDMTRDEVINIACLRDFFFFFYKNVAEDAYTTRVALTC